MLRPWSFGHKRPESQDAPNAAEEGEAQPNLWVLIIRIWCGGGGGGTLGRIATCSMNT